MTSLLPMFEIKARIGLNANRAGRGFEKSFSPFLSLLTANAQKPPDLTKGILSSCQNPAVIHHPLRIKTHPAFSSFNIFQHETFRILIPGNGIC